MTSVQKAVFPGTIVGVLFLIFFTSMLTGSRAGKTAGAAAELVSPAFVERQGLFQPAPPQEQPAVEAAAGCAISSSFPQSIQQWCDLIGVYASKHNLEPNLVASVMLQESGGNPDAYSKSGAVGLMQVMPRDGLASKFQCINGPCFASRPSTDELYDPEFNISYGTKMLSGLVKHYGNVRDALKAYGPMDMGYRYADIVLSLQAKHTQ
jgi:hypothetical protein